MDFVECPALAVGFGASEIAAAIIGANAGRNVSEAGVVAAIGGELLEQIVAVLFSVLRDQFFAAAAFSERVFRRHLCGLEPLSGRLEFDPARRAIVHAGMVFEVGLVFPVVAHKDADAVVYTGKNQLRRSSVEAMGAPA